MAIRGRIGSDFNSARLAEPIWPGYGHGESWDWIDGRTALVDCYRLHHPEERQTFFGANVSHPIQDDHLLCTPDLIHAVSATTILDNETTRRVSDHVPVQLTLAE